MGMRWFEFMGKHRKKRWLEMVAGSPVETIDIIAILIMRWHYGWMRCWWTNGLHQVETLFQLWYWRRLIIQSSNQHFTTNKISASVWAARASRAISSNDQHTNWYKLVKTFYGTKQVMIASLLIVLTTNFFAMDELYIMQMFNDV